MATIASNSVYICHTIDISKSGIFFESKNPIPFYKGTLVEVFLILADGSKLTLVGKIIRIEDKIGNKIKFALIIISMNKENMNIWYNLLKKVDNGEKISINFPKTEVLPWRYKAII